MEDFSYSDQTHTSGDNFTLWNSSLATLRTSLIVNCVVNAMCSLTASFGNTVVLVSIWNTPALHSPSNTLLFSLALTDLLVGILSQPLYVASRLIYIITRKDGPVALQAAFDITSSLFSGTSFMIATIISVDRYLALKLHMRYPALVTSKKLRPVILGAWLLSSVWVFFWFFNPKLFYFSGIVSSAVCFSLTIAMYFKIYRVVRHHEVQIRAQTRIGEDNTSTQLIFSRYTRSVINSFYVCFLLFLCYSPYLCTAAVIQAKGISVTKKIVLEFAGTITFINSSVNPVVYFWRVSEIRMAIRNTLQRCKCKTNKVQSCW